MCDRAFFRRGDRWVDGNSVVNQHIEPDERVAFASARFFELKDHLEAQGRSGVLSLRGEILLDVDGKNILVTTTVTAPADQTPSPENHSKETHR